MSEIDLVGRLRSAARQIQEESRIDAEKHYASETPWFKWNYFLGVSSTLLAALASATAFSKIANSDYIAGFVALLAAIMSALFTFLDPSKKASSHHVSAKSFEALYRKARLFYDVESHKLPTDIDELDRRLKIMLEEYNQIKTNALPIPGSAYRFVAKLSDGSGEVTQVSVHSSTANTQNG